MSSINYFRDLKNERKYVFDNIKNETMMKTLANRKSIYCLLRNSASYDLGLVNCAESYTGSEQSLINRFKNEFDFVILTEYFNEGLILLKKMLNLSYKDIVCLSVNQGTKKVDEKDRQWAESVIEEVSNADVILYNYYLKKYKKLKHLLNDELGELKRQIELYQNECTDGRQEKYFYGNVPFLNNFILIGCMYSLGIILKDIKNDFGITQKKANLLPSLNIGFRFLSGPLTSALASQFGCRKVIMLSALVHGAMYIISPLMPHFELMLVSFGFIGGISYGCTYLTGFNILVEYFDRKLGFVNGLAVAASGFGSFAFAPLTGYLITSFGWKITMYTMGLIHLLCFLFAAFLKPLKNDQPSKAFELENLQDKKDLVKKESAIRKFFKEIINFNLLRTNKSFFCLVISNFFVFFAYYIPFIYIPIRAQSLGIENYAWIISVIGMANIPIRILFGFLCDRKLLRAIHMNSFCLLLAAVLLFSYNYLNSFMLQIVFGFLFALPTAGINCLSTKYIVDAVGSENFRNANGITNMFKGIAVSLGPFLAGFLSEKTGSDFYAFVFAGLSFLIAFIFSLISSLIKHK
ncbi:monocarboxylate transporter 2 [Brachionus plicatilis]|uniref:Monocarboxylate transporter 2 n=1 Tax=Brachionus plicatilis TaxID=10195 RepID=A0A3M7SMB0_BRAPC|nr:monocarboxylate transporter 2 [Brachionus plicatilis]